MDYSYDSFRLMYIVPLLSRKKICEVYPYLRYNSIGFGNLLFPFMRSLVLSISSKSVMLSPFLSTVPGIHDIKYHTVSRNYTHAFSQFSDLFLGKAESFRIYNSIRLFKRHGSGKVLHLVHGIKDGYSSLNIYKSLLLDIINNRFPVVNKYTELPAVHVRLGDFLVNKQAISLSLLSDCIRKHIDHSKVVVYSDTPSALVIQYLNLQEIQDQIIFSDHTMCPMQAIMSLSLHPMVVGNHLSSFFTWAKFFAPSSSEFFTLSEAPYTQQHLNGMCIFNRYV